MKGNNKPLYKVRYVTDLKDMLNSSTELYGDKPAFYVKRNGSAKYSTISFKEYKRDVEAFGTVLVNLGLKDKRIVVISENRYEWAVTYMSVVNGAGVIVPLDKELPPEEIENLIKTSNASAIVYSKKLEEKIASIKSNLENVKTYINMDNIEDNENGLSFARLIQKGNNLVNNGDENYINQKIDPNEMRILLFTSGTTGLAKGVMLCHRNLCVNVMETLQLIHGTQNDIWLSVLPLHHTYECTHGFLTPLYLGASIAYCEGLRHIVKNMKESKATIMMGVPLIFEAIYRRIWKQVKKSGKLGKLKFGIKLNNFLKLFGVDLSRKIFKEIHENFGGRMRLFISGAAAIDSDVYKGFEDLGFIFTQGYGLTECSPIVALNRDCCRKYDSVGFPLPSYEVKIVNCNKDNIGEIICKGDCVMLGYYNNEEATKKVLKNGWFYTGDLGYVDKDGFLHITGRKKDVIVTKNGKNVFPEEVELYLNRSQYIKESLVWGKYDQKNGETYVNAQIVPDFEAVEEKLGKKYSDEQLKVLINKVIKEVNHNMPLYKRVVDFTIREKEFKKTTTRKIKRYLESPKS